MRGTSSSSRLADRVGCGRNVAWFVLFVWMCGFGGGSKGMVRLGGRDPGCLGASSGMRGDGRALQGLALPASSIGSSSPWYIDAGSHPCLLIGTKRRRHSTLRNSPVRPPRPFGPRRYCPVVEVHLALTSDHFPDWFRGRQATPPSVGPHRAPVASASTGMDLEVLRANAAPETWPLLIRQWREDVVIEVGSCSWRAGAGRSLGVFGRCRHGLGARVGWRSG